MSLNNKNNKNKRGRSPPPSLSSTSTSTSTTTSTALAAADSILIWNMNSTEFTTWIRSLPVFSQESLLLNKFLPNLVEAVTSLLGEERTGTQQNQQQHDVFHGSNEHYEPTGKRMKLMDGTTTKRTDLRTNRNDFYDIWIGHSNNDESYDDIPTTFGGICVQLTLRGLLNAMSLNDNNTSNTTTTTTTTIKNNTSHPNDNNDEQQQLLNKLARAVHRAIQIKMERDYLRTTPCRIQEMLCPEVTTTEFTNIRKRVYDTVILGKGTSVLSVTANDGGDVQDDDAPVMAKSTVGTVEKFKKCPVCGNNDQALFVLDSKNGDVICSNCGAVTMESIMHEGSQYRKFEGEADRNHHGDAANPLYSDAHNMATTLGGMQLTSSVHQGFGTQSRGIENILRNAHAYTEMNLSTFGKREGRTRVGYKDRQKRDAFHQMTHVGDALNLHEAVVQRAKELFAGFRDDRELVQQFKGVIAACLCEAFDQLSRDGHRLLKLREQDKDALMENSKRANRRNELHHHASMAGKGGLLLDFSHVANGGGPENGDGKPHATSTTSTTSPKASALEQKAISSWDLDDCRSFLLESSRHIAQLWIKERNAGVKTIPGGSQDELEGKLVEHTISLCDQLEAELKTRDQKAAAVAAKKVVTPRVRDMAHLSIKWQHSHERGSGGKGGVGGSGHQQRGTNGKPTTVSGRTAGQLLILKTSKKLGSMLKDPVAGEAFHKELRALAGRQEARKRKEMAVEASRQRFQQMKRKPWLQARAASGR